MIPVRLACGGTRFRRLMCRVVLAVLMAGSIASAEVPGDSPEDVVAIYMHHLSRRDWEAVSRLIDPQGLSELKELLITIAASSPEGIDRLTFIFGPTFTLDRLKNMEAAELFARLMEFVNILAPKVTYRSIVVLGSVPEGDEFAHVVVRIASHTQYDDLSDVHVVTTHKSDAGWRVMFKSNFPEILRLLEESLLDKKLT